MIRQICCLSGTLLTFSTTLRCPRQLAPRPKTFLLTPRARYASVTESLRIPQSYGSYRGGMKGVSLLVSQVLALQVSHSGATPPTFAEPEPRSPKIAIFRTMNQQLTNVFRGPDRIIAGRKTLRSAAGRRDERVQQTRANYQQLTNAFVSDSRHNSSQLIQLRTVVAELAGGTNSRLYSFRKRARSLNNLRTLCAHKNTLNSNPLNHFCTRAHQKAPQPNRAITIFDFRLPLPGRAGSVRPIRVSPRTITPHVRTI